MDLNHEPKILAWKKSVVTAGCAIRETIPLNILRKKNNDLLFALLDADILSPEGHRLPNIIFIRGDACVVVTLLRNRQTREERFLMVRQRRTGNGQMSLEFPAGMLDADVDNPCGVAARELAEETGIAVSETELFPLVNKKLYSSAGASDEAVFYFGCIKEFDAEEFDTVTGRSGGNPEENEHISVALMSRDEAEREATSLQVMLGFYLFEKYCGF
jgi:8-oxo-dGTP pyrophosphatase MutT (NUDIX family)